MSLRPILLAVFLVMSVGSARADFRYAFDTENSRWQLNNGEIEAVFQLTPSGTFEFQSLTGLKSEGTWTAPIARPSSPIRFTVDDIFYNARTRFTLVKQFATAIPNAKGYRQVIVLRDVEGRVEIGRAHV